VTSLTRRSFIQGVTAGSLVVFSRSLRAADYNFVQYHNQTAESPLHKRLLEMWANIGKETGGRVETRVMPENNKIPGSDPQSSTSGIHHQRRTPVRGTIKSASVPQIPATSGAYEGALCRNINSLKKMAACKLPIHKKTEPKTILSIQRRTVIIKSACDEIVLNHAGDFDRLAF